MLFLLFQLEGHRYALDALDVVEVLPLVSARKAPHSPEESVGLFIYRGRPVPLIDFSELILGRAARLLLSTRIILLKCEDAGHEPRMVGLLAEQVSELVPGDDAAPAFPAAGRDGAPYLRSLFFGDGGIVQCIDTDSLVSHCLGEARFEAAS